MLTSFDLRHTTDLLTTLSVLILLCGLICFQLLEHLFYHEILSYVVIRDECLIRALWRRKMDNISSDSQRCPYFRLLIKTVL